jgi:hypothetical protein
MTRPAFIVLVVIVCMFTISHLVTKSWQKETQKHDSVCTSQGGTPIHHPVWGTYEYCYKKMVEGK